MSEFRELLDKIIRDVEGCDSLDQDMANLDRYIEDTTETLQSIEEELKKKEDERARAESKLVDLKTTLDQFKRTQAVGLSEIHKNVRRMNELLPEDPPVLDENLGKSSVY